MRCFLFQIQYVKTSIVSETVTNKIWRVNVKKKWILFLSFVLAFSNQGLAKGKAAAKAQQANKLVAAEMASVELPLNNDEFYNKFIEEIKKTPRSTAAAVTDVPAIEKNFDKDFLQIREELIGNGIVGDKNEKGVTTVEQLDQIINKYSEPATYKVLSNQAKFVALQLRSLKSFKSFIFRAKLYIGNISATRTMIVTALRSQIAGIQSFFPVLGNSSVNHWEVVFNYITQNTPNMGPEIRNDQDLYVFFTQLAYDYAQIVNDFKEIVTQNFKPIWWDNKLYMSFASFASEKDRYVLLDKPELYALYSASLMNLSVLSSTTAYSFDGLQSSIKAIGQLFGVDSISDAISGALNGQGADGMSSYSRIKVLNSHPNLFVIMPDGKKRMSLAYDYLKASVRAARVSYEETKKLPEGKQNLFDPRVANAFNRIGNSSFANIDTLVDEKDVVTSAVLNGERVKVSLKNFYDNPPERLSELYPTNWDLSTEHKKLKIPNYSNKGQFLRNYKHGMATEWKLEPYKRIFPEISGNGDKTKEVPKYARILSQTWGSAVFAIPLGAAIF